MFFVLSQIVGALIDPASLLLLLLLLGTGLAVAGRAGRRARLVRAGLVAFGAVAGLWGAATVFQLGARALYALESQIARPASLPAEVTGIVVLGGGIDAEASKATGRVQLARSGDRVAAGFLLARRYPGARLVYSGGSGELGGGPRGATYAQQWYRQAGLAPQRLTLEAESRNTWQNARNSYRLLQPRAGTRWLLVTSAAHMPRALGAFAAAGWPELTAYPANRRIAPKPSGLGWDPAATLDRLGIVAHELVGMAVYRLTGRWQAPAQSAAGTS